MRTKRIPLRRLRMKAKLTQAELAARIKKPQSFISKLETGAKTNPPIDDVRALGAVFGVDPLSITFGQPDRISA